MCSMHGTCLTHLTLFDLVIVIMLVKCTSYEAPHLNILLHPFTTSSLLGPNIALSTLLSDTLEVLSV